jgi:hypothetical protein
VVESSSGGMIHFRERRSAAWPIRPAVEAGLRVAAQEPAAYGPAVTEAGRIDRRGSTRIASDRRAARCLLRGEKRCSRGRREPNGSFSP